MSVMGAGTPIGLQITYPTRRSVLASYRLDGSTLSLFVPTAAEISVGAQVELFIGFGDSPQTFSLVGQVTWRRVQARGMRLPPGLGIDFKGGAKFAPAQMLAFCAGRALDLGTALDPRVAASIPCRVALGKRNLSAQVRDISSSGAFVAARNLGTLAPGRELSLTLDPGWFGWGGKVLAAKVVWSGSKLGAHGFGARFIGPPSEVKPAIKKYLRKRAG